MTWQAKWWIYTESLHWQTNTLSVCIYIDALTTKKANRRDGGKKAALEFQVEHGNLPFSCALSYRTRGGGMVRVFDASYAHITANFKHHWHGGVIKWCGVARAIQKSQNCPLKSSKFPSHLIWKSIWHPSFRFNRNVLSTCIYNLQTQQFPRKYRFVKILDLNLNWTWKKNQLNAKPLNTATLFILQMRDVVNTSG